MAENKLVGSEYFGDNLPAEQIIVLYKSGLPIVMFDLVKNEIIKDNLLISGFLTAIKDFIENTLDSASNYFSIGTNDRIVSIFKHNNLLLAVIGNEEFEGYGVKATALLEFMRKHYNLTDDFVVIDDNDFDEFKLRVVRIFLNVPICSDWIPVAANGEILETLAERYSVLKNVDGKRMIREFPQYSEKNREDLYRIFNWAFYMRAVDFLNILEPRDYIIKLPKLENIIRDKDLFEHYSSKYPSVDIIALINILTQNPSMKVLHRRFGKEIDPLIMELLNKKMLRYADESLRRLLIVIDITEELIRLLKENLKAKDFDEKLGKILEKSGAPEIRSRIIMNDKKIAIRKENLLGEKEDEYKITERINSWLEFDIALIEAFYKSAKRKIDKDFYDLLVNEYINNMHEEDMVILEKIITVIERLGK